MPYVEGNLTTGHRATIRTGLPTATWRKLNAGIPTSKSRTNQVDATCGMLEARGAVDKELARLNGNTASFRASENIAFLEAMNETMAETTFRSEEHTSELQSLMRISYAVFCLKKKTKREKHNYEH